MKPKGIIFPDYFVRCGNCFDSEPVGENEIKKAAEAARQMGWKKTVNQGWLCPHCLSKIK